MVGGRDTHPVHEEDAMPEKKQKPRQPEREREDVEAELPQAPARDPIAAEPTPVDATRGPRPPMEPERE